MIRLPNDFKDFLKLCDRHAVEYVIVGGYAVGFHGHPRATFRMIGGFKQGHSAARSERLSEKHEPSHAATVVGVAFPTSL